MTAIADERPVPSSKQPSSKTAVVYTVGLKTDPDGNLMPCFVGTVPNAKAGDGPLEIRIMENCIVTLNLDASSYDWEFKQSGAVTLGTNPDHPEERYFNLVESTDPSGRYVSLSFDANYFALGASNVDHYNLYVLVYMRTLSGERVTPPLAVRIDPDIKNPGDNPG